jgi:hypothetical protein
MEYGIDEMPTRATRRFYMRIVGMVGFTAVHGGFRCALPPYRYGSWNMVIDAMPPRSTR